jgi:argininosuccinate lyase
LGEEEEKVKLWGGRFEKEPDRKVEEFTRSLPFDKRLFREDIMVNLAWAEGLSKIGILDEGEFEEIKRALSEIESEMEKGDFKFLPTDEDIHTAIERALVEKVGEAGAKIHTGKSRNDQVVTDLKIYLKKEIKEIAQLLEEYLKALYELAEREKGLIMPGYTHLQPAQPVLFSHYILAYFWMGKRDFDRLVSCYKKMDYLPLGSGAFSGTSFPIDRKFLAQKLSFSHTTENSVDAVSSRDFALHFLNQVAILMVHLSRLGEDLVIWNSKEFSFIEFEDSFTTGSSLMPQKKNPDPLELVRAKAGRVIGNWVRLATVLKGLPLSYNRDLQEDKEALFDSVDTVKGALSFLPSLISTLKINPSQMRRSLRESDVLATEIADFLVEKGVPFREAHRLAGEAVKLASKKGVFLESLSLKDWQSISPLFTAEIKNYLSLENSLQRRNVEGGTSPQSLQQELEKASQVLSRMEDWLT